MFLNYIFLFPLIAYTYKAQTNKIVTGNKISTDNWGELYTTEGLLKGFVFLFQYS